MRQYKRLAQLLFFKGLFVLGIHTSVKSQQLYVSSTEGSPDALVQLGNLGVAEAKLAFVDSVKMGPSPGYIALNTKNRTLYIVTGDNRLHAWRQENDNTLLPINSIGVRGKNPCHVHVDINNNIAYVSNYSDGSFSAFSLRKDGSIEKELFHEVYTGNSVHPNRQKQPHAHSAITVKDGKYVYVADLGTDRIMLYSVTKGKITPHSQKQVSTPSGAGPRHMVVSKSESHLYVLNELDATISAFSIGKNGELKLIQTYKTLPNGNIPGNTSAAIRLHPSGKYLYVSNRGYNAIHSFQINLDGSLNQVNEGREGIEIPRDFNITPDGKTLLVANLKRGDFAMYTINQENGSIAYVKNMGKMVEPSCILFLD